MSRKLFICLSVLLASGCSSNPTADDVTTTADLSGQTTYEQYCASCHDSGAQGAPIVGQDSDWVDRSKLWQAVLMDHAKSGYLAMPAKGGSPELSEKSVDRAVQYMLERTHQDMPGDQ